MVLKELVYDYLAEGYYRLRMLSGYCRREAWSTAAWKKTSEKLYDIWFMWESKPAPNGSRYQRFPAKWNPKQISKRLKR